MPHDTKTPILIVGAGPVGLALAGDLGWRGVPCLLIEQSDGSIYQPRMDLVGIRTMEFCRRWGLVSAVEASPYPRDLPQDNVYVTSLSGYELGRERFPTLDDAKPPPVSPQRRERCPQNMFDPILRDFAAAQSGVEMRYRTRLVSFTQDRDGVTAEVENLATGEHGRIRADYLVGLRRRAQPGARGARDSDGGHRGAHLHDQCDLPLSRAGRAARQGPGLSVHHPRARRDVVDHRGDQRHRSVALLHHRRHGAARIRDRGNPRADPSRRRPGLRLRDSDRHAVGAARAGGRALRRRAASSWPATPFICCRPPAPSA